MFSYTKCAYDASFIFHSKFISICFDIRFIEALTTVCTKNNLKLERIDYNEACDGKDECDRKFSLLKRAMRYYCDEGNDILSASDMMKAIIERCTNQNIKCCVTKITKNTTILSNTSKIKDISKIHSIKIDGTKMTVWNFFNIGEGKDLGMKQCEFQNGSEIIESFKFVDELHNNRTEVAVRDKRTPESFECETCHQIFLEEVDYEQHVVEEAVGNNKKSSWDEVLEIYKTHVTVSSNNGTVITEKENNDIIRSEVYEDTFFKYWAVKSVKRGRFNKKQKDFMKSCFEKGARSGN